jgi:hypothetical protein
MAYVYSSEDVQIAWSGVPLSGFAEDSFVSIVRTSDLTAGNVGADSKAEISRLPDRTGTVTLSLQQGSVSARALAATIDSDDLLIGDMTIADPSGSVFALCKDAHIMTAPEITRGVNAGDNTNDFVFWCEEIKFTGTPSGLPAGLAQTVSFLGSLI